MKSPPSLSLADHRLLDLVWSSEPISSPQLCKLAQAQLGWKRTTTYTVIKRLCDKGCLKNEAALVDRATVQQADGQEVLQRSFHGSLPSFLAAFLRAGSVSDQEAAEIEQMLEEYRQSH